MTLDFGKVMNDAEGVQALLKFAQTEFAEELVLFWLEVVRFKRDLADEHLWKEGGLGMDATNSPAQQATGDSASSAAACGSDPFGSPDNPFDNDDPFGSSHGAGGGSNVGAALLSRDLPAEAATGDRQCYLKRTCEYIVDTYLTNGAAFQVTFADHQYKVKCASANGGKGCVVRGPVFERGHIAT